MQVPTNMLGCDLEGEASSDSHVTKLATRRNDDESGQSIVCGKATGALSIVGDTRPCGTF